MYTYTLASNKKTGLSNMFDKQGNINLDRKINIYMEKMFFKNKGKNVSLLMCLN